LLLWARRGGNIHRLLHGRRPAFSSSGVRWPNAGSATLSADVVVFGKVVRLASEKVTLQLMKSKCIPVLLYGLLACPLNKSQLSSLDFAMNRFLMKLFSTSNIEIITYGREQFNFELPRVILARHTSLFLDKLRHCDYCLIKMLCVLN